MERARKQQQPKHSLKQGVREIDPGDDPAHFVCHAKMREQEIQPEYSKRRRKRDDQDPDGRGQLQKEIVDRTEKRGEHDCKGGDLKKGHDPSLSIALGLRKLCFMSRRRSGEPLLRGPGDGANRRKLHHRRKAPSARRSGGGMAQSRLPRPPVWPLQCGGCAE